MFSAYQTECNASCKIQYSWHLLLVMTIATIGCGSSEIDGSTIATAQQNYDAAVVAFEGADYTAARTSLDEALKNPAGLNADTFADALLKRSICLSFAGELEAAEADITAAEQGATDMALVYVARGVLLAKQGDEAGAKKEFANAKRENPKVYIPEL